MRMLNRADRSKRRPGIEVGQGRQCRGRGFAASACRLALLMIGRMAQSGRSLVRPRTRYRVAIPQPADKAEFRTAGPALVDPTGPTLVQPGRSEIAPWR